MAEVRAAAHLAAPFSEHQLSSCESKAHVGERQTAPKPQVLTWALGTEEHGGNATARAMPSRAPLLRGRLHGLCLLEHQWNFPGSGGSAAEGSITTAFCR